MIKNNQFIENFYNKNGRFPFIVIEGLDGAGKTTLAENLCKEFNIGLNYAVPDFLKEIRKTISKTKSPVATFKFFSLCNILRSSEFRNKTKKQIIISDRYLFSTISYHQEMLKQDLKESIDLFKSDLSFFWPDYVLYITADAEIRKNRITDRESEDFEQWYGDKVSFTPDLDKNYINVFEIFEIPYKVVDTSNMSIESSFDFVLKSLRNRIM